MQDLEAYSLWKMLVGIVSIAFLYYVGTRGVILLTRHFAGRWYRHALVSLSFAVLFAPSLVGVEAGGMIAVPAWVTAADTAGRGRWLDFAVWGLGPIGAAWILFFGLASLGHAMSNNNKNKVDTHGKEK